MIADRIRPDRISTVRISGHDSWSTGKSLARLLGRSEQRDPFNEHVEHDGAIVFQHACRMGLEGIVSKRLDAPYRSGPSKTWLKSKNPLSEAVRRERDQDWS